MKHSLDLLPLSNHFASMGEAFFSRVQPTPFTTPPKLVHFNRHAAELLDLDPDLARTPDGRQAIVNVFSGKKPLSENESLAMLYAGHQFGHYVPQLGDGRAIIIGETTNQHGERWEIQLKGSGITPYSRDGDGRAVLRSTIREYLCSEAMHGLGIPTTRALCIVGSDDEIYREKIEPGAMMTRLAPSHLRFGSFEVFFYREQYEHIRALADFTIAHFHSKLTDRPDRYACWLEIVIERTAALIAQWQAVGFSHGVLNSDNMSILGLTIDYGPFGFMEAYDPDYICNHSDHHGRYAFRRQPDIGLFNLTCFAQAILPILSDEPDDAVTIAKEKLGTYHDRYKQHFANRMRAKLGLNQPMDEDEELVRDLLSLMAQDRVDFTILFRKLCGYSTDTGNTNQSIRDLFIQRQGFDQWSRRYRQRLGKENSSDKERYQQLLRTNPKYVLRNYMAEIAIRMAEDEQDFSEIEKLFQILHSPFDEWPEHATYAGYPPEWANQISVSCSS